MTKEWGFLCLARVKNGMRAKIRKRGWGGGRKEMLADKHLDFETLSPANGALDWLD